MLSQLADSSVINQCYSTFALAHNYLASTDCLACENHTHARIRACTALVGIHDARQSSKENNLLQYACQKLSSGRSLHTVARCAVSPHSSSLLTAWVGTKTAFTIHYVRYHPLDGNAACRPSLASGLGNEGLSGSGLR